LTPHESAKESFKEDPEERFEDDDAIVYKRAK
jgi:hypothetical protein